MIVISSSQAYQLLWSWLKKVCCREGEAGGAAMEDSQHTLFEIHRATKRSKFEAGYLWLS